jgi:hypothetical protein
MVADWSMGFGVGYISGSRHPSYRKSLLSPFEGMITSPQSLGAPYANLSDSLPREHPSLRKRRGLPKRHCLATQRSSGRHLIGWKR